MRTSLICSRDTPLLTAPRTWALNSCDRFSAMIMERLIRLRSCRLSPGRFHRSPQQYWVTYSCMSREKSVAAASEAST